MAKYYHFEQSVDCRGSNRRFYESHNGPIAVICPKCFKTHILNLQLSVNLTHSNSKKKNLIFYRPIIRLVCDCSHEINSYDLIDPNIAPIIAILNKKKYYTLYCCEGHYENFLLNNNDDEVEGYTRAYIIFAYPINDEILDKFPIPAPWIISTDDSKFIIYCNEDVSNHYDIKDKIRPLRKWANSLPINVIQEES